MKDQRTETKKGGEVVVGDVIRTEGGLDRRVAALEVSPAAVNQVVLIVVTWEGGGESAIYSDANYEVVIAPAAGKNQIQIHYDGGSLDWVESWEAATHAAETRLRESYGDARILWLELNGHPYEATVVNAAGKALPSVDGFHARLSSVETDEKRNQLWAYVGHSGAHNRILTREQHGRVFECCDGYGKRTSAELYACHLDWDWSHVRDSSDAAINEAWEVLQDCLAEQFKDRMAQPEPDVTGLKLEEALGLLVNARSSLRRALEAAGAIEGLAIIEQIKATVDLEGKIEALVNARVADRETNNL